MELQGKYKLYLKSSVFYIPTRFRSLKDVDDEIYSILTTTQQYEVKSNVSEESFQQFLKHWVERKIPEMNENNIQDFQLLSEEFDRMKDLIEIFQKKRKKINCYQSEIQQLKNENKANKQKIDTKSKIITKMIRNIQNVFGQPDLRYYNSKDFKEVYANIYKYFIQEKYTTENGLTYSINKKDKTATLLFDNNNKSNEFIIPTSINVNSVEYIVVKIFNSSLSQSKKVTFSDDSKLKIIGNHSFAGSSIEHISIPSGVTKVGSLSFWLCSKLQTIVFPQNSQLKKICKKAFESSSIQSMTLPSSVEIFEEGWCSDMLKLNEIIIWQNETQNIIYFDDSFILGKSDQKSDNFDILLFARRDIESAKIPSFIKRIESYAFEYCSKLESVEFSDDSELLSIGKFAFSKTKIKEILIPSHLTKIEEYCFNSCKELKKLEFADDSELKYIGKFAFCLDEINPLSIPSSVTEFDEGWCGESLIYYLRIFNNHNQYIKPNGLSFIVGKSDLKSDNFDTLLFANCYISSIKVPSFIKQIEPYAFDCCLGLQDVEFEKGSKLKTIKSFAFKNCPFETIMIPSSVIEIEKYSFYHCPKLKKIEFEENSNLLVIGHSAFAETAIKNITIPPNVKKIDFQAFNACKHLRKVEFAQNSELTEIKKLAFANTSINKISIPPSVTKIGSCAFLYCNNLQEVEFSNNSKLKSIGKLSFSSTLIDKIIIPSSVVKIGSKAFQNNKKIKVIFADDSNLLSLKFIFDSTSIISLSVPPHIKTIDDGDFMYCKNLQIIEILENSEIEMIDINAFYGSSIDIIMIPFKLYGFVRFNRNDIYSIHPPFW